MTKRVLMIAFHFPPSGAVAAQRASKFARYLPEFGWEPIVVARRPDPLQPRDESFAGKPAPAEELQPSEGSRLLGVHGTLEREGEVVHLIAKRLVDHSALLGALQTTSRDFH